MVRPILLHHCRQAVTLAGPDAPRIGPQARELAVIPDASILVEHGRIAWVGPADRLDAARVGDAEEIDCSARIVLPGFVDCHTHAMFAGSREDEFSLRAGGATYEEIAAAGGGILSTVRATRAATKRDLKRLTSTRLDAMLRHGTTTVEIKSGYGLTEADELKMLEALRELREEHLATIVPTFLGAHAVPPEFAGQPDAYIELLTTRLLPYIRRKGLAAWCDVFCESGYFSVEQSRSLLRAARDLGFGLRLHADQLNQVGASALGASLGAATVEHLERIDAGGIEAVRVAGTMAVLLPGSSFFLGGPYAPARRLLDASVPVAVASNFNPGSSMSFSLPLMMTIACTQMGMTPEEALTAVTINAAASLGMAASLGSISPGKAADLLIVDAPTYRYLPYHFGVNLVEQVIKNGVLLEFA